MLTSLLILATKEVQQKFIALADAWDSIHGFRHGDKVDRSIGGKRKQEGDENETRQRKPHPNQYDFAAMNRMSFASIGRSTVARRGIDGRTHTMAPITVAASIA